MSKRYIIALDSSTKEQNDELKDFVSEHGLGWWHWIKNFWLITDPNEKFSASRIQDVLAETHFGIDCFVIELNDDGDTWAGYGPKTEKSNMFRWIKETWNRYS